MLRIKDLNGAKPKVCGGNVKLGEMGSWSTMKGSDDEIHYIDKLKGECSGTCGPECVICTKQCYVNKSYKIYPSVLYRHAVNTTWIKEDVDGTFREIYQQLKRKKIPYSVIRINQSGELTGLHELTHWKLLAERMPDTQFYVYTKNYNVVNKYVQTYKKNSPTNFTILISIWHHYGTSCYNQNAKYPYIKAFVYDDGEELALKPTTYCNAYNETGHLNHNITCDKCKKCFNRIGSHKIIGCKSH